MYIEKINKSNLINMRALNSIGLMEYEIDGSNLYNPSQSIFFNKTIFSFGEIEKNWTFDYNEFIGFKYMIYLKTYDFFASHPEEVNENNELWKVGFKPKPWLYIVNKILKNPQFLFQLCGEKESLEIKNNNELKLLKEFENLLELSIQDDSIITFNYSS